MPLARSRSAETKNVVDLEAKMHAADFGHALGTRGAVLATIFEEFHTRAIATAQEDESACVALRRACAA